MFCLLHFLWQTFRNAGFLAWKQQMFSLSGDFEAKRYLNFFEHLPTNFLVHLKIAATHTFCST
jgi:hypothetical protein